MKVAGSRLIRSPADLDGIRFDPRDGLVPIVAQDATTGDVLMLAFADRAALARTLETGEMHYHSRSRGELWHKGATSGHTQRVRVLVADCDADAVLALVEPAGPACHTGSRTCFGIEGGAAGEGAAGRPGATIAALWRVIEQRAAARPAGSYTARLLEDPNLRIKKLGEEVAEFIAAMAANDRERVQAEAADLAYHLLVALCAAGASLADVEQELERRRRPGTPPVAGGPRT